MAAVASAGSPYCSSGGTLFRNLGAKIMYYFISCIVFAHNLWLIKVSSI